MELSKITICRQDVIVISDTEAQSNETNTKKKKKSKRKTECIRNVKLTKMTVNRTVPNCYRLGCRNAENYRKDTCNNTKYQKRESSLVDMKYTERKTLAKKKPYETDKNDNVTLALTRNLCSPITVSSSSDTFENISSCSFDIQSSDSDEIENLIKVTRKRMRNETVNINSNTITKSAAPSNQYDYQNNSSNDGVHDSSVPSMDNVLLCNKGTIPYPAISPAYGKKNDNKCDIVSDKELSQKKLPSLSNEINNGYLSPLYEISGKVFMEHYLNTNVF